MNGNKSSENDQLSFFFYLISLENNSKTSKVNQTNSLC